MFRHIHHDIVILITKVKFTLFETQHKKKNNGLAWITVKEQHRHIYTFGFWFVSEVKEPRSVSEIILFTSRNNHFLIMTLIFNCDAMLRGKLCGSN